MSYWDFVGTPKDIFKSGCNYFKNEVYDSARECFERAYDKCEDDEEYEEIKKKCKNYIYECECKIKEEESLKNEICSYFEWGTNYRKIACESKLYGYSTYETAIFNFKQALTKIEQYLRNKNPSWYSYSNIDYYRYLLRECEENIKECEEAIDCIKYGDWKKRAVARFFICCKLLLWLIFINL